MSRTYDRVAEPTKIKTDGETDSLRPIRNQTFAPSLMQI